MKSFHDRFDIQVGLGEARQRFMNRVCNEIFNNKDMASYSIVGNVATALGDRHQPYDTIEKLVKNDFMRCLLAIETLTLSVASWHKPVLQGMVRDLLALSEVDLGVEWDGRIFRPKGAELLDEHLVNDPLKWLRAKKFSTVLMPFEKGLKHLVEAHVKKDRFQDVVTDMYEAVEALAKMITGRDRDLHGNRELFIKNVKASDVYKQLLKDYAEYAQNFRHAAIEGKPKPSITEREAESFVYLTGIFIRLAMPDVDNRPPSPAG